MFIYFLMPHSGRHFLRFWCDLVPKRSILGAPWRPAGPKVAPKIIQVVPKSHQRGAGSQHHKGYETATSVGRLRTDCRCLPRIFTPPRNGPVDFRLASRKRSPDPHRIPERRSERPDQTPSQDD